MTISAGKSVIRHIIIACYFIIQLHSCDSVINESKATIITSHKPNIDSILNTSDTVQIIIALNNYITYQIDIDSNSEQLSKEQINFHIIQELEMEVNNGGFSQYFYNSSGNYAHETLDALLAIKAYETHKLLQAAINEFPNQKVPKDREERLEVLAKIEEKASKKWDKLDQIFFKYPDNLDSLNMRYISVNKSKFH